MYTTSLTFESSEICKLYCDGDVRNPWMCCIEKILNICGLSYMWQNHVSNMNVKLLKCVIKQNLRDQFLQKC